MLLQLVVRSDGEMSLILAFTVSRVGNQLSADSGSISISELWRSAVGNELYSDFGRVTGRSIDQRT